jgi:hypothetical protein
VKMNAPTADQQKYKGGRLQGSHGRSLIHGAIRWVILDRRTVG